jgi:hypothetical protein
MHGILVALPSGIMFGLFWAVKQFHVYCLIFSRKLPLGAKTLKNSQKSAILWAGPDAVWGKRSSFIKI